MAEKTKTINAGPVGLKPRGAYSPTATYTLLECVLYNHDSWVCTAINTDGSAATISGQTPADGSAYWIALTDGGRAAYAEGQAAAAATTGAENVDVEIDGMILTVTNRQGVSRQVNVGFEIYRTYTSKAQMKADAANVPAGKFVMIGTTNPTDPDNATLWMRNSQSASSQNPFDFVSDLDQASSEAWADWLNNMKPLIEQDHSTAQSDHSTATTDHSTAQSDHTAATNATAAANNATTAANNAATYANNQGNYSKNMADHPAYIGEDNYWYIWNYAQQKYVKSSYAKGDDLDWESMTEEEKQALADEVLSRIAFDSKPTSGSSNAVTSGGIYTALGNREKIIEASVATSQSIVDELT